MDPRSEAALQSAERFAAEVLRPHAEAWEAEGALPLAELHRAAAQEGLTLLMTEAPDGHGRLPLPVVGRVAEILSTACMPAALPLVAHNYVAWALRDSGNEAARRRYLPGMRDGECLGTFCLTEPQGGSDPAALQTVARRDGAGWILDGEKAWVMRAEYADFFGVYAQTEPGSGSKGIAMFLVDADVDGIERFPFELFAGHAFGMGGFRMREVRLGSDALLVPPGKGLHAALAAIDVARATVASMCCGLLARGIEEAVSYTGERQLFGQRVADFQGIQWMLADAATDLEASRALAERALAALEAGRAGSIPAAHAKKFATRVALARLVDCMQVMGANGAKRERAASRHLGYAKLAQYLDGATEIQNVVISRDLFRAARG